MALTQRMELRTSQALVMTPQLQQAIKLLELSNQELTAYVESELEQNPLLERDEGDEREAEASEPLASGGEDGADPEGIEEGADPFDDAAELADDGVAWDTRGRSRGDGAALDDTLEQTLTREIDLREHLLTQLGLDIVDPTDRLIGVQLIDLLDDAGYIAGELSQVASLLDCPLARVEATLEKLQRFDPPGIFARNLRECLALQLRDRNRLDPAMQALLDHLDLLAKRDRESLMRLCGVDAEDLADMAAEIRALNPKPALAFDRTTAPPVQPDIIMRRHPDGGWIVELNNDTLPRVLVDRTYYARVIGGVRRKADREYLAERLGAANWLVKSLHQRATTILRVASEIIRQQDGFFRHGVQHLRPLIRRDIAAALELHESTVSRVTTNKYIATPRGLYELRYFFTTAIASSGGGDAHSAESVRSRIRQLVDAETIQSVLSDDQLVDLLRAESIDIARRTVAKYRESMRIPSSVQRRRDKSLRI